MISHKQKSRRDSKTFIQIFEGTPNRRKTKKGTDFNHSLTMTKGLPPRPDRRKDSAPGSLSKRPALLRNNMESPGLYLQAGDFGGVNHTFDNFSSDFDLTCQKKPLLRVNSPYEAVGAKRLGLRDFSADSRKDTQSIITPKSRVSHFGKEEER